MKKCPFCKGRYLSCFDVSKYNEYTNTMCHSCNAHFYGKRGQGQWFTGDQWEEYVNAV